MKQGQFIRDVQMCPGVQLSPVTEQGVVTGDHLEQANPAAGLGSLSWGHPTLLHRSSSALPWLKLLPDLIIPDSDFDSLHHLQPEEGAAPSAPAPVCVCSPSRAGPGLRSSARSLSQGPRCSYKVPCTP